MEHPNADLIHLIAAPCFCVREGVIVSRNAAAESLPLSVGDAVTPLLLTGAEEYAGQLLPLHRHGGEAVGRSPVPPDPRSAERCVWISL